MRTLLKYHAVALGCAFFVFFMVILHNISVVKWDRLTPKIPNDLLLSSLTSVDFITTNVSSCGCSRTIPIMNLEGRNSTCSDETSYYDINQNVVSYSYHLAKGKKRTELHKMYVKGIEKNLMLVRKFYPGFKVRVYTDREPDGKLCPLLCQSLDLQWCNIKIVQNYGDLSRIMHYTTWRFLPLGDPTVHIVLSRDLDGVISEREVSCVYDWLNETNKSISIIRDHPLHVSPILAGTWGANNNQLGMKNSERLLRTFILQQSKTGHSTKSRYGYDELLLKRIMWKQYAQVSVAYDSYLCSKYTKSMVRPIPVQRKDNCSDIVQSRELCTAKKFLAPCPLECRPSYGQNWTYC